jgi:hypothetical protein
MMFQIHFSVCLGQENTTGKLESAFQKKYQGVSVYGSILDLSKLNSSLYPAGILSVGPDFKSRKLCFSGRLQFGISGTSDTVFSRVGHNSLYNWRRPLIYTGFEGELSVVLMNGSQIRIFLVNCLSAGIYSNSILPVDAFGYHSFTFRTLVDDVGTTVEYRLKFSLDNAASDLDRKPKQSSSLKFRVFAAQSLLTWPKLQTSSIRLMPGFSIGFYTRL